MKDGLRFVDCDMHVMEPADLFPTYLDPKYTDRVTFRVDRNGVPSSCQILWKSPSSQQHD